MDSYEIIRVLKEYKNKNSELYGIKNIGFFGSYAKNQATEQSDIDIVVELQNPDIFKLIHIKEELESIFNKPVDIVRKRNKMNPYLKKHIEQESIYV